MAEFCLDCLRRMDGIDYDASRFELSREPYLCEGCGQFKRVVIAEREPWRFGLLDALIALLRRSDDG